MALLLALAFLTNTLVNAVVFRFLGNDWPHSLLAAAFLAQIGELGFVFAQVGLSSQLISKYTYQLSIAVIAASLVLSPIWISLIRRATRAETTAEDPARPPRDPSGSSCRRVSLVGHPSRAESERLEAEREPVAGGQPPS